MVLRWWGTELIREIGHRNFRMKFLLHHCHHLTMPYKRQLTGAEITVLGLGAECKRQALVVSFGAWHYMWTCTKRVTDELQPVVVDRS